MSVCALLRGQFNNTMIGYLNTRDDATLLIYDIESLSIYKK